MRLRSPLAPGYEVWGRSGLYEPLVAATLGRDGARLRPRAVAWLALRRGEAVLDLATGTGPALPLLADAVGPAGRVVGVDRSPAMLEHARGRAASPPLAELHTLNWPRPDAVNQALTAALRPFNTWHGERDLPPLVRARGCRVRVAPVRRPALSLTVATAP
jgi:SAM-dependent methyltransferase